ncbi:MAG: twin-arginine translocation signal domain-containing protein, partial [Cyclobacteriaceae bacterium]|nr:twin-arginine translocation signal domain-containing protein [Cyclobacteriaceae bacterium]
MKTTRRDFIKQSALAVAGGSLLSTSLFASPAKNELLGLQLYCVRDEMKADPLNTLKELAKIGYKHVEHANYVNRKFYGWTPAEFKKVLSDLGMKMPSGHTVLAPQHWDSAKKDFT